MFEKFEKIRQRKQLEKSNKIRAKNDKLQAEGKEPIKTGWNTIVHSGVGGLNKANSIDTKAFISLEQKDIPNRK